MADSKQLYQEVILDHNRKPRNWGVLPDATHRAEGHNPLCGDHLTLTLGLRDEAVNAINFQGESCAICKASASMMTTAVKAIYEDGVFKPKEPVHLEEKTEVEVLIPDKPAEHTDDPTGWKTARELIGCIKDGPREPIGRDHDKYLYE